MFKNLVLLVIGAIISVVVQRFFDTATLEYRENFKEQYINLSNSSLKDLSIQYKNKKIDSVSMYQMAIYNRSLKDLENVKIYFKLRSKNGEEIPRIINREFIAPNNSIFSNITEIEQKEKNTYVYNIKVLKKTGRENYYLLKFVFQGKQIPNISVSIPENKDIDIKEYSFSFEEYGYLIISGFIILIIVVFFRLLDSLTMDRHWDKRKIPELREVLLKMRNYVDEKTAEMIIINYEQDCKPKHGYIHRKFIEIKNKLFSKENY